MKFVSTFDNDFYQRIKQNVINSSSIETKNDDEKSNLAFSYEIERLLNRRIIIIDRINYLIKWKKYESKHNVWYFLHVLNDCQNLVNQYDETHSRSNSTTKQFRRIKLFIKRRVIMSSKRLIDNISSNIQISSNSTSTNSSHISMTSIVIILTTQSIKTSITKAFILSSSKTSNIKRSSKLFMTS